MEKIQKEEKFEEVKLTEEERDRWIKFHKEAYKEDQKMADNVLADSPRWSVIMAYYAMHNISKLYLAKIHNIKVSGRSIHAKTLNFISKHMEKDKEKIIPLLEQAKKEYETIISSSMWVIPRLLSKGRDERAKIQYYSTSRAEKTKTELMQIAQYFMDNFMKPYIKIVEGML